MKKKIINYFLIAVFVMQIFASLVWLNMLTINAAARQYQILVHRAWSAQNVPG